jgi:hypothetical protein
MKYILILLTIVSIFGIFSGSQEPVIKILEGTSLASWLEALHNGNTIFFKLSAGILVSIFFWFIVVYVPERKRKKILKHNLAVHYQNFKEDTIQILLLASGSTHDSKKPKELCDYRKFKDFFLENKNEKWYAALNGLQANEGYLNDILVEIEILTNEVAYVLNNVRMEEEKVYSFFKRLSANVCRLKNSSVFKDDPVKHLGTFLFGILARWSIIEGQKEEDVIQLMIDRI